MLAYTFVVPDAVSPPTRGWTPTRRLHAPEIPGFPAHAGMDLHIGTPSGGTEWFPRPRGDGPYELLGILALGPVSPPTRGWTLQSRLSIGYLVGFPAHAGMDHVAIIDFVFIRGFPRPRGDGPAIMSPVAIGS